MNETLTTQDLDILIASLDDWINSGSTGALMGGLLSSIFANKDADPEVATKIKNDQARRDAEYKTEKARRERVATILKAKLYTLQAQADTDGIIRSLVSNG